MKKFCLFCIVFSVLTVAGIHFGFFDFMAKKTGTDVVNWLYGLAAVILMAGAILVGILCQSIAKKNMKNR